MTFGRGSARKKATCRRWERLPILPKLLILMVTMLGAAFSGQARAQDGWAQSCTVFQAWQELPNVAEDVEIWQAGLRAALSVTNPDLARSGALTDGKMGPGTGRSLEYLCAETPLVEGTNVQSGTFDLARHYAELTGTLGTDWAQVAATGLPSRGSQSSFGPPALRAAGGAAMAQAVFQTSGIASDETCAAFVSGSEIPTIRDREGVQVALRKLAQMNLNSGAAQSAAVQGESLASICRSLPVVGSADAFVDALSRLGKIENMRPGALAELASPEFAAWLAEEPGTRLRRLLGTPEAVPPLLASFVELTSFDPVGLPVLITERSEPEACRQDESATTISYFHLTKADLASLNAANEALKALLPLLDQPFETAELRLKTVLDTLKPILDDCARAQIKELLSPVELGRFYRVDPEAPSTVGFKQLEDPLRTAMENNIVVTDINKQPLIDLIVSGLSAGLSEALDAEISEIADKVAGVAEPMVLLLDTPAADVPPFDPGVDQGPLEVTPEKLADVVKTIDDLDFREALQATELKPAATPDAMKADVAAALSDVRNERIREAKESAPATVDGYLRDFWSMKQQLINDISALPSLAPLSADYGDELPELVGLSYPTEPLFYSALRDLNAERRSADKASLNGTTMRSLLEVSKKTVIDPEQPRMPLDLSEGCGCVAKHKDDAIVYGIWPFWEAPAVNAELKEPPTSAGLNMEVLDRVAYWGIKALKDGSVWPAQQWQTKAAARFIASAHRHQAKADLAIELVGWKEWDDPQIESIVKELAKMAEPFSDVVFETRNWRSWLDTLPAAWDSRQIDGLTLFVDGYDKNMKKAELKNIETLVDRLKAQLKEDQTINLALDVRLSEDEEGTVQDAPEVLFSNLADFFSEEDKKENKVDLLLVFLERGTSSTKKKMHTTIIGEPGFSGVLRDNLFESIVPVLPKGANEKIFHSGDEGGDSRKKFGQLEDDLVYFRRSFAGVGFWTALRKDEPAGEGASDAPAIDSAVAALVRKEFDAKVFWLVPDSFNKQLNKICKVICPNRFYVKLSAAIGLSLTILLIVGSPFIGGVRRLAHDLRGVQICYLLTLALLALLATCVARPFRDIGSSYWSIIFVFFVAIGFGYLYTKHRDRGKSGPKP